MQLSSLPSIRTLVPLEEGGSTARSGFIYQDHVAASYCIKMLSDADLHEIWCEAEDDITLIRAGGAGDEVELVQVKSDSLDQLWSVALICSPDRAIAAKSLAHDRCAEPCSFRLVTRIGVKGELAVLRWPADHEDRTFANPKVLALHKDVCERLGDLQSPRGLSPSHWLASLVWEVAESEFAIENANLRALEAWLESVGEPLFSDQRQELYERLLRRIMKASLPKWKDAPGAKKLQRDLFIYWFKSQIAEVKGVSTGKAGEVLRGKMRAAGLDEGVIETAEVLRRRYRHAELDPKYMRGRDTDVEGEAIATLNLLLSQLDRGALNIDGVAFHGICLDALASLRVAHPEMPLGALQAAMYVAADRCRHRFLPARA